MLETSAFLRAELPRPDVSLADAAAIFEHYYDLKGKIVELGSQQDRNFRIDTGERRYVLKICLSEYDLQELDAQNKAFRHISEKKTGIEVAQLFYSKRGEEIVSHTLRGQNLYLRLLSYLDGEPLTRRHYLSERTRASLGATAAKIALALKDFDHPGLVRDLQWDSRKALAVARSCLRSMGEKPVARRILDAMEKAQNEIDRHSAGFRTQAVHHDITDDNIVARPDEDGHPIPAGVIDFGDLMRGWLVGDITVTCAALLHHADGDPFYILPAIKAFHAVYPLNEHEIAALWPLIVQRAGLLVASSEQQLSVEPDNAYVLGNIEHERVIFETAVSIPSEVMSVAIAQALGVDRPASVARAAPLFKDVAPEHFSLLRLDVLADGFKSGNWTRPGIADDLLAEAARKTGYAATRYGEYRLSETRHHSADAPSTFALFIEAMLPAGTQLIAPFAGDVTKTGTGLVLRGENLSLHIKGVPPGTGKQSLTQGADLAALSTATKIEVQLSRLDEVPPRFVPAHQADAWKAICPSPSILFGGDFDAPALENEELLAVREAHFAKPQKNYYKKPPQIERGYREQMYATSGRTYLDMVNNVAILGHGHEKLSEAVGRQWSLLNTNSRFHYAGIAEFSRRLAELAPEGLDTVFLVNSGSEANDLAIRLAWAHSGARNILSLLEAYHGWTVASDAVSTSIADNPQALSTRPAWVHAVTSPNTYRGPFRGVDSARGYIAEVERALEKLDSAGERLGGFICESVYGNSGGIPLPKGYLKAVYDMVHARGGVTIADEVQVGYGRLGHYFWGFGEQGVVPDIITIAKGMGNGHPLGAVITTRAIADSLEKEGYFFSSAGGSPVSCVVGMTVLDALRDEKLIENARDVGDHLKSRLEALGQRFPLVGAVHGMGLYLGLEYVRDRETLEPATVETARICDRLLDLGVIMQPTGDHLNVLKIKPPLCLSKQSADFFADMLARVLEEGW